MPDFTGAIAERLAPMPLLVARPAAGMIDLAADGLDQPAAWVRAGAARALDHGATHYTSRPGEPRLRAILAERLNARHGTNLTPDDVVITDGGTEALHVALRILLAETALAPVARRLITTTPGRLAGPATAAWLDVPLALIPTPSGRLTRSALVEATQPGGVLLLASPDQPTGQALDAATAGAVADAVARHDLQLVLDESLVDSLLPGRAAVSPLPGTGIADQSVLIGSFSVAHRLAGWRVGYLATHSAPLKLMRALKQAISICAAAVSQHAAIAALEHTPPAWLAQQAETAERLLAGASQRLNAAGLPCSVPDAYPFLWVDIRPTGLTSAGAVGRLAEAGIAAAPGTRFGAAGEGFIRLTLDPQGDDQLAAVERLAATLREGTR